MKRKKSMVELRKMLAEFKKDPELVETARQFVIRHGGQPVN